MILSLPVSPTDLLLPNCVCANPRHCSHATLDMWFQKVWSWWPWSSCWSSCADHDQHMYHPFRGVGSRRPRLGGWQISELFRTTHKVKAQQVAMSRGEWCGEIDLVSYLVEAEAQYGDCPTGPRPTHHLRSLGEYLEPSSSWEFAVPSKDTFCPPPLWACANFISTDSWDTDRFFLLQLEHTNHDMFHRRSTPSSNLNSGTSSPKLQQYV